MRRGKHIKFFREFRVGPDTQNDEPIPKGVEREIAFRKRKRQKEILRGSLYSFTAEGMLIPESERENIKRSAEYISKKTGKRLIIKVIKRKTRKRKYREGQLSVEDAKRVYEESGTENLVDFLIERFMKRTEG